VPEAHGRISVKIAGFSGLDQPSHVGFSGPDLPSRGAWEILPMQRILQMLTER